MQLVVDALLSEQYELSYHLETPGSLLALEFSIGLLDPPRAFLALTGRLLQCHMVQAIATHPSNQSLPILELEEQ